MRSSQWGTAIRSSRRVCACRSSKHPATRLNRFQSWCSIFRKTGSNLTPFSLVTRCSSVTWARPDLRISLGWTARDLGAHLYNSLHNKLLTLPDEVLVYPAHGAGSLCGKQLSSDTVSSLGEQRRLNYALQPMSKEEFIRLVTADQPEAPPYFTYDAVLNTRERATLDQNLGQVLHPIDLAEVLRLGDAGAQIIDVREATEAHLAGTINIGLSGQYATWAGTLLNWSKPIVIIAEPGREQEAVLRLGRIGLDRVRGYLRGGMEALASRPDLVWSTNRITAPTLAEELASADPPVLLDVRNPREWAARHIDGSLNMPLNKLQERISEIPLDRRIAVHCASGYRSSIAASILHQYGITNLMELAGGLAAWEAASLHVDTKHLRDKAILTTPARRCKPSWMM